MRGFMRALEKAGLVEREGSEEPAENSAAATAEDVDALIARELTQPSTPPQQAPREAPASGAPCDAIETRSFESIFTEAAIPASPFPAEKMLRLLDGLKTMDLASRKIAVEAMDAADDSWTVDDAVLDAQRKILALTSEKDRVSTQTQQLVALNLQQAQAREEQQRSKVEALRLEIAELERAMATEIANASADKATLMTAGENARLAAQREATRLDTEIERLNSLTSLFGTRN